MEVKDDRWCFVCGRDNPRGLQQEFRAEGDTYTTEFQARSEYQGYAGMLHGGILSTLLDEVMVRFLYHQGYPAVTAELQVRFLEPVRLGEIVTCRARVVAKKSRLALMEARAEVAGRPVAEATAKCMRAVEKN